MTNYPLTDLISLIIDHDIKSFSDLDALLRSDEKLTPLLPHLFTNSCLIKSYIFSRRVSADE